MVFACSRVLVVKMVRRGKIEDLFDSVFAFESDVSCWNKRGIKKTGSQSF